MRKLFLLLFLCAFALTFYGQLIIDHNHCDITTLSEAEINLAKSTLHIFYAHTSHGSQVTTGMNGLVGFANDGGKSLSHPTDIFDWNNGGTAGALDFDDHYGDLEDVGSFPAWRDNTLAYLGAVDPQTGMGTNHPDVNVIMWSWCGQASSRTEQSMIDTYLDPMTLLEATYPNVKFVYMTGHLDGSGATGNLNLRNQQIRDYCNANNKILYDFADIESYDPDGLINYMELICNDGCYYDSDDNGSQDANWASNWRAAHVEDIDWYSCSSAHSDALNANQKAYAAWHMFVETAKIIADEAVPADLTVSDTIVADGESACFNATNSISVESLSSAVTFENGSSVNFIAGNDITLLPGFHAQLGSYTHAYITTDESYCFTLPTNMLAAEATSVKSSENMIVQNEENGFASAATLKVFPNPSKGQFTIQLKNTNLPIQILIFNSIGAVVYQASTSNKSLNINLSNSQTGIYFVRAFYDNEIFTQKLILE